MIGSANKILLSRRIIHARRGPYNVIYNNILTCRLRVSRARCRIRGGKKTKKYDESQIGRYERATCNIIISYFRSQTTGLLHTHTHTHASACPHAYVSYTPLMDIYLYEMRAAGTCLYTRFFFRCARRKPIRLYYVLYCAYDV